MIDEAGALEIAARFIEENVRSIDTVDIALDDVRRIDGIMLIPYNNREFLRSGNMRFALLDNLPLIVDFERETCRFMTRDELDVYYPF